MSEQPARPENHLSPCDEPEHSGLATASLLLVLFMPPLGVILGVLAVVSIIRSRGRLCGLRDAAAGVALNLLFTLLFLYTVSAVGIGREYFSFWRDDVRSAAVGSRQGDNRTPGKEAEPAFVDQDLDGIGEYGLLAELAGESPCRGSGRDRRADPCIPRVLGRFEGIGVSRKSGYYFRIYIPAGPASAVSDAEAYFRPVSQVAVDLQERKFIVYAWPVKMGVTGDRVFVIDAEGTPYAYANQDGRYSGPLLAPLWDAALADTNKDGKVDWEDGLGAEGWVPCG